MNDEELAKELGISLNEFINLKEKYIPEEILKIKFLRDSMEIYESEYNTNNYITWVQSLLHFSVKIFFVFAECKYEKLEERCKYMDEMQIFCQDLLENYFKKNKQAFFKEKT